MRPFASRWRWWIAFSWFLQDAYSWNPAEDIQAAWKVLVTLFVAPPGVNHPMFQGWTQCQPPLWNHERSWERTCLRVPLTMRICCTEIDNWNGFQGCSSHPLFPYPDNPIFFQDLVPGTHPDLYGWVSCPSPGPVQPLCTPLSCFHQAW